MFFIENLLPPLLAFAPGAKIGLSNVVSLLALILLGYLDSYIVVIVRCVLGSIFSGNMSSIMYSLPSALASLTVMIILYQFVFSRVSLTCISVISAIVFNLTQLLIAALIVQNIYIISYLPLMLLASVLAGVFVGLVAHYVVKALPKNVMRNA